MQTIQVATRSPYQIHVGQDLIARCGPLISALPGQRYRRVAVVTDDMVGPRYAPDVIASLEAEGYLVSHFTFPHGETSKNLTTATALIDFLTRQQLTRTDLIVALGGGVTGDMAGFAASVYLRGIDYVQLPTSLLAALDSSVGGKTAVNIPAGKNLMGTFWQPRTVICDVDAMATLSPEHMGDGIAEGIKYGCIWDASLLELFQGDLSGNLSELIARCVSIKAQVVQQDEGDRGLRQILNFGHTAGHGIEKLSGFTISHGRGVAVGMVIAAAAGEAAGLTPAGTAAQIRALLTPHGLPTACPHDPEVLAAACLGDKKRSGDEINLILLQSLGKAMIHPVKTSGLAAFLAAGKEVCPWTSA